MPSSIFFEQIELEILTNFDGNAHETKKMVTAKEANDDGGIDGAFDLGKKKITRFQTCSRECFIEMERWVNNNKIVTPNRIESNRTELNNTNRKKKQNRTTYKIQKCSKSCTDKKKYLYKNGMKAERIIKVEEKKNIESLYKRNPCSH